MRVEWEQNDELVPSGVTHGVGELSLGGIHDWTIAEHLKFGLGASYTFDFVPSVLTPVYDSDPHGTMVFARVKID